MHVKELAQLLAKLRERRETGAAARGGRAMQTSYGRRQALLGAIFPFAALALLNGFYKLPLHRVGPAWYWLADVLQFVAVPLLCAWFVLRPAGIDWRALGLQPERHAKRVSRGTLLFTAAFILLITWPMARVAFAFGWQYADELPQVLPAAWWPRVLVAAYMAVSAALVEEVAFRALPWLYVREVVAPRWRRAVYLVGSTLFFALIHVEQGPAGVISAGWFGWMAAVFYLRLGSLWPAVLAHFALDFLIFGPW
jgi:membrane protease YdiL (CAAX protease family)